MRAIRGIAGRVLRPNTIANQAETAFVWPHQLSMWLQPNTRWVYPPANAIAWGLVKPMRGSKAAVQDYITFVRTAAGLPSAQAIKTLGIDLDSAEFAQPLFVHLTELVTELERAPLPGRP